MSILFPLSLVLAQGVALPDGADASQASVATHAAPAEAAAGAAATVSGLAHFTTGDGVRIAYAVEGPVDAPVLVLSNSIGTDLHMWDGLMPGLARHFRVIRYDMRGHGASGVPAGDYSLDRYGRDVLELLDALGVERAHFLGLSLGGFVGQWLGIHAPGRIDRLVLSNTAAWLGPAPPWDEAIARVRAAPDMTATAEQFLGNWFPPAVLAENGAEVQRFRATLQATDRNGLAGAWAIVRDADLRRTDALIRSPTLVIAGERDTVTSLEHGREIAEAIPDAQLVVLPSVHLPNVEMPGRYLQVVLDFLQQ